MTSDDAPLEALLTGTFSIGLDVSRGRGKVALVRLRRSRALLDAAQVHATLALAAALQAAAGLQQLLAFRHDYTTVTTPAEQAAATAAGKDLIDDASAKKAIAELTRD